MYVLIAVIKGSLRLNAMDYTGIEKSSLLDLPISLLDNAYHIWVEVKVCDWSYCSQEQYANLK